MIDTLRAPKPNKLAPLVKHSVNRALNIHSSRSKNHCRLNKYTTYRITYGALTFRGIKTRYQNTIGRLKPVYNVGDLRYVQVLHHVGVVILHWTTYTPYGLPRLSTGPVCAIGDLIMQVPTRTTTCTQSRTPYLVQSVPYPWILLMPYTPQSPDLIISDITTI